MWSWCYHQSIYIWLCSCRYILDFVLHASLPFPPTCHHRTPTSKFVKNFASTLCCVTCKCIQSLALVPLHMVSWLAICILCAIVIPWWESPKIVWVSSPWIQDFSPAHYSNVVSQAYLNSEWISSECTHQTDNHTQTHFHAQTYTHTHLHIHT